tara:strand:+ start:317 stop:679 length:363 start_codon:yes stop_codon:yes gene_type:complete
MAIQQLILNFPNVNISAQIGDILYFTTSGGALGGFDKAELAAISILGPIININGSIITAEYEDTVVIVLPVIGDFFMFVKDKRINTSSLLGYYASVNFVNDSRDRAELFSVSSDVSESSK